jgi:DnaJ-class molecular chaperone
MSHEKGTFGTDPHLLHRVGDPDTSVEAAHAVDTTKLEAMVFNVIKRYGPNGCIQDDVLKHFRGYPYSSITARFRALLDKPLIEDAGERRVGNSGRKQRVLRALLMTEYFNHTNDAAFEGLEKKSPNLKYEKLHECKKCRGYGGWILTPNAYGEGKHFKAGCSDCAGWGFTETEQTHAHEWDQGVTVGRCMTEFRCNVCNIVRTFDSSD